MEHQLSMHVARAKIAKHCSCPFPYYMVNERMKEYLGGHMRTSMSVYRFEYSNFDQIRKRYKNRPEKSIYNIWECHCSGVSKMQH